MKKVTDAFLDFATEISYEALPVECVKHAKLLLLDGIGNMLGGIASDKGKIGITIAHQMGGTPQSTVYGVGGKVSMAAAAFANAELLNGLDMDPIPHIPPIVLPSILAVAEAEKSSGKDLLTATVLGQEISHRLTVALSIMAAYLVKYGKNPDVFGNSNENILGAAIGNAMLMKLEREKMGHALGIAAYFCSLPVCRDWESTSPKSLIKYVPVSWLAQGAVQAAMLARAGYTGNAYTLDSQYGFPVIYCREESPWDPQKVIENLGENWVFLNTQFKPYPCCRYLHSSLDVFYRLKAKHDFSVGDIKEIRCNTGAFVANPDQYSIVNQIDAQFSGPYNMALAAFGYVPGPAWQDKKAIADPRVNEFMQRVKLIVAPEFNDLRKKDRSSFYSRVEIEMNDGTVLSDFTDYNRGSCVDGYKLTDDEMKERFRVCASAILTDEKIENAINIIMNLEQFDSLDKLVETVSL